MSPKAATPKPTITAINPVPVGSFTAEKSKIRIKRYSKIKRIENTNKTEIFLSRKFFILN
jgi:predicted secreted protein